MPMPPSLILTAQAVMVDPNAALRQLESLRGEDHAEEQVRHGSVGTKGVAAPWMGPANVDGTD